MRFAELISRNIVEPTIGSVVGKFKGRPRRYTLFFEDILAEYDDLCNKSGNGELLREIGEKWTSVVIEQKIPNTLKRLPKIAFINLILRPLWVSNGVLEDIRATQKGDLITIETKNEGVTRITGRCEVTVGMYMGALEVLFESQFEPVNIYQSKNHCKYVYKILPKPFSIKTKTLREYDKLNKQVGASGTSMSGLLKSKTFQLKENNRIFFRDKGIVPIDNTLFHLIGHYNLNVDKVKHISYDYFKEVIDKDSPTEKKLLLLKTLLQAMGWGIFTIKIKNSDEILINIKNPPYGSQLEKDNWEFLIMIILGYLWTIDRGFKIKKIKEGYKELLITFSM